jgi:chromosome segregation ATPase
MEFSDYAANETSALVTALIARRSQESLASFLAFRKALEEVTRTIETWAHVEPNDEVTDHVRRLAAEAQALADQRTEMAKGTIDGLREQLQAIELKLAASNDRAEAAETDSVRTRQRLDAETSERQKLAAALEEARNQLRSLARTDSERKQLAPVDLRQHRWRCAEGQLRVARHHRLDRQGATLSPVSMRTTVAEETR